MTEFANDASELLYGRNNVQRYGSINSGDTDGVFSSPHHRDNKPLNTPVLDATSDVLMKSVVVHKGSRIVLSLSTSGELQAITGKNKRIFLGSIVLC